MIESAHPSDYSLDRGGPQLEGHLATCEQCRARAVAAADTRAEFERRVMPSTLPLVRERLRAPRRSPRRSWRWFLLGAPVLAAAAVLLLVRSENPGEGYVGIKGSPDLFPPSLEVFVKRGDEVTALRPGEKIRSRDSLRFVFRGDHPRHLELRIVGADKREVLFYPQPGPVPLVKPGDAIPGAVVVDDVRGTELVIVRAADRPFETTDTGPTIERHRITLDKEP